MTYSNATQNSYETFEGQEQKPLAAREGQPAVNQEENPNAEEERLSQGQEENQQQEQQAENAPLKDERTQDLERRLGYSLEDLGAQPQQDEQQGQEAPEGQQQTEDDWFRQRFQEYFGVDPQEAAQRFQELQQFRQQQLIQQQQAELQREWGDAYQERLEAVKEYFNNRLTPEQQQALDNADGARLIWARIQQEQMANQPQVPNYQQTTGQPPQQRVQQAATPQYKFTKSQIDKMSRAEYENNIKEIEDAIMNGLVNFNK